MAKKGGSSDFVSTLFASGIGAYAAKNSTSVRGLLWTLAKYALVAVAVLFAVMFVLGLIARLQEGFSVPVKPSAEGDEKLRTPAGNVIMY